MIVRPHELLPPVEAMLGPDTGHQALRQALASQRLDDALPRLTEHEVALAVSHALADGLELPGQASKPLRLLAQGTPPKAASAAPAPAAAAAPRAAPAAAPAPAGPQIDAAAMAQVLIEAARDGVPFCEECAKAAAAQAAGAT
jgi:hypothetical protein